MYWHIDCPLIKCSWKLKDEGDIRLDMEFGVYTLFGMANLNMDRNWRIGTLTVCLLNDHEN